MNSDKKQAMWVLGSIILAWVLYSIPQATGFMLKADAESGGTTHVGYSFMSVFTLFMYLFAGVLYINPGVDSEEKKEGD